MLRRDLTDPSQVGGRADGAHGDHLKDPIFENIEIPEIFGPVEIIVDDFKIKRFAFTQDDFGDWYLREGPFGSRIGQPGLLANDLLQLFTTRYDASRVVGLHTSEELWFERPVNLGSRVLLAGRYLEKYEKRGQGYVVMEAEARDQAGNVLVRHTGTEIMRTRPGDVAGRGSADTENRKRVSSEYDRSLPLIERLGEGVLPGHGLVPLQKTPTFEQAAVFSRLGEFVTNIHNNLDVARRAGLALPIVQGQQQACYLAELMARCFGEHWFSGGWLKTKFLRPVAAFETLEIGGVVRDARREKNQLVVDLDVWIRKEKDGSLMTVGWASGSLAPGVEVIEVRKRAVSA